MKGEAVLKNMTVVVECKLAGAFSGYHGGAVFRLSNGQAWQQRRHKYKYKYAYRPQVRVYRDGSHYFAEFDCMNEAIEVVRVRIVEEGQIVSDFRGFGSDAEFEFRSGNAWEQAEYKYEYHYAYRPNAVVVDGIDGLTLHVDGLSGSVRVRRA